MKKNVLAIVQARMGSTRFPGKVMASLAGKTLIEILIDRLKASKIIDGYVVATTKGKEDNSLASFLKRKGIASFRGSRNDVLGRYLKAAKIKKAQIIVRITGDCPLVDPALVDAVIKEFLKGGVDYVSNVDPPTFPDGLDVEVFSFKALVKANRIARHADEREHVTLSLRKNKCFKKRNISSKNDYSFERWTVDEPQDLLFIKNIFQAFSPRIHFAWREVIQLKIKKPGIFKLNLKLPRNEGATLGTGQKLWKRAKTVIPGGNMLLSKRAEMFLPGLWPAYFKRAKGCHVWDLDGRKYVDMSIMGIGTNILGYGHPAVDEAVRQTISKGNMSTLNCPEEVYLAEKLIELHPWAEMVRLARTGGEANAIAIRIARAATGKEKVAVCGYHGWHDWYLSANLADDHNLDGHLLPGLEPKGVPRNLKGTVFPFRYNQYEELESLVRREDIGVVKMEVERNEPPKDGYLEKIRKLCFDRGIVLIFDECTSGFRETYGGLHKKYNVEPDMAMFGKALGNGYAITAVLGKKSIMEAAQNTFISSTFWTERIGPTAALKSLEIMQKEKSWLYITQVGLKIRQKWVEIAKNTNITIKTWGIPALGGFSFTGQEALACKTFLTQELLEQGILAGTSVYCSLAHSPKLLAKYLEKVEKVFGIIKDHDNGLGIRKKLKGPICHAGFKRIN